MAISQCAVSCSHLSESDDEWIDISSHQSAAVELVKKEVPSIRIDSSETEETTDYDEESILIAPVIALPVILNSDNSDEWIDMSSHQFGSRSKVSLKILTFSKR